MTTTTQTRIAAQILTAYHAQGTEWVSIETIRDMIDATEAQINAGLLEVALSGAAHVMPVANLKSLTRGQRDAAVVIGGEPCHVMMIEG